MHTWCVKKTLGMSIVYKYCSLPYERIIQKSSYFSMVVHCRSILLENDITNYISRQLMVLFLLLCFSVWLIHLYHTWILLCALIYTIYHPFGCFQSGQRQVARWTNSIRNVRVHLCGTQSHLILWDIWAKNWCKLLLTSLIVESNPVNQLAPCIPLNSFLPMNFRWYFETNLVPSGVREWDSNHACPSWERC